MNEVKEGCELMVFFWYFQKGTKAPGAAGKIHTDFEKGFIMAEVMKFDDFKEEGSEAACKVSEAESSLKAEEISADSSFGFKLGYKLWSFAVCDVFTSRESVE